jgi:hypothetical protein
MTCFWNGTLVSLSGEDFKRIGVTPRPTNITAFINLLKDRRVDVKDVKFNGSFLADRERMQDTKLQAVILFSS